MQFYCKIGENETESKLEKYRYNTTTLFNVVISDQTIMKTTQFQMTILTLVMRPADFRQKKITLKSSKNKDKAPNFSFPCSKS